MSATPRLPRLAIATLGAAAAVAVLAHWLAPYDPFAVVGGIALKNAPPSVAHPFGTDPLARDVLSRVLLGSRISLGVATIAAGIAVVVGTLWGAIAGSAPSALDDLLMRVVDAVLVIPRVLILLLLASAGAMAPFTLATVLGLTAWPPMSRIVRAQVRAMRTRDHVLAARALGLSPWRILSRHVLPGVLPHIVVAATVAFASVIPLEAGVSFLGLGVAYPTPSWGNIMHDGAERMLGTWWLLLFPGIAIIATVVAANALAEHWRARVGMQEDHS